MRPEYIEATDAARWNFWFYIMLVAPAVLIWLMAFKRKAGGLTFVTACIACWLFFGLWVQYYWAVKMELAMTPEESQDATSDTARLFGPVLVGVPFTLIYCTLHAALAYSTAWVYRRVSRPTKDALT